MPIAGHKASNLISSIYTLQSRLPWPLKSLRAWRKALYCSSHYILLQCAMTIVIPHHKATLCGYSSYFTPFGIMSIIVFIFLSLGICPSFGLWQLYRLSALKTDPNDLDIEMKNCETRRLYFVLPSQNWSFAYLRMIVLLMKYVCFVKWLKM